MSAKTDLEAWLSEVLSPSEQVLVITTAQIKKGKKSELVAKNVAGVVASTALLAATGGTVGLITYVTPPAAWVVGTSERLLLVERLDGGSRNGKVVFHAPRSAITVEVRRGILTQVEVLDRADGASVLRLNLGAKGGAARAIEAAVNRGAAD